MTPVDDVPAHNQAPGQDPGSKPAPPRATLPAEASAAAAGPARTSSASSRVWYRPLTMADIPAVSALHAGCFGPGRFARAAYRVREGTPQISPHCRGAFRDGSLLAALRMTEIAIGESGPHLLLGPLAVARDVQGQGFGKALVADAITAARTGPASTSGRSAISPAPGAITDAAALVRPTTFGIVLLVGDLPYYGRFGFKPVPPGQIVFPGPVNPSRILAVECHPGALAGAVGMVRGLCGT